MTILLTSSPILQFRKVSAQSNDIWYLGKGIDANSYITYQMSDNTTGSDEHYNITLYFSRFVNSSNTWYGSLYVERNGTQLVNKTIELNSVNLSLTAMPSEQTGTQRFLDAYSIALDWLPNYFSKPGIDLRSIELESKTDKLQSPVVYPIQNTTITVPAGDFLTLQVARHFGQIDSMAWINKDLPFPVKGEVYGVPQCNQTNCLTVKYSYELLAVGQGIPKVPELSPSSTLTVLGAALAGAVVAILLARNKSSLRSSN